MEMPLRGMEHLLADRKDPITWSTAERNNVRAYLERIDATDAAFNVYQRALRENKNVPRDSQQSEMQSSAAATVEAAEHAWKQAKHDTVAAREVLGALQETMVELGAGKKASREALRERLRTRETAEPSPADVSPVAPEEPVDQPVEQEKSFADLERAIANGGGLVTPLSEPAITVPKPESAPAVETAPLLTPEPQPSGFIGRIARSRVAKAVYALGAMLGIATKAAAAIEDMRTDAEKRGAAHATINELARESSLGMAERYGVVNLDLPSPEDIVTLDNGETMERSTLIDYANAQYTQLMIDHHGPMGTLTDLCSTTLSDGSRGLDALKCNDIYGDQIKMKNDPEAIDNFIAKVHGYTPDEIRAHGAIIRNSIMQNPGSAVIGDSTIVMNYFDRDALPGDFKADRDAIYDGYYSDASRMAFAAVKALDIAPGDRDEIKTVQQTIKAEIKLSNATILAANDVLHLNTNADALITGMTDKYTHQRFDPHIDLMNDAEQDATLAWKMLAAYETEPDGPIHTMERALLDVHHTKKDTLLRAGRDAGDHVDFFLDQLEKLGNERHR